MNMTYLNFEDTAFTHYLYPCPYSLPLALRSCMLHAAGDRSCVLELRTLRSVVDVIVDCCNPRPLIRASSENYRISDAQEV